MMNDTLPRSGSTIDTREVERFRALASKWWDPEGEFRPLHAIGPARLQFMREQIVSHFGRDANAARPFDGLRIADIGCGGGLISEPLARLGGSVTGIDPALETIEAAQAHAMSQGLEIDYRAIRVEDLAAAGENFDIVVAMEVVEHVPDLTGFLRVCASILKPGGLMLLSTLNRTLKAYLLAIVGAEYVLRWLPAGTHQWERFVKPDELGAALQNAGLHPAQTRGISYNPLTTEWRLSRDTDVNYLAAARKPE